MLIAICAAAISAVGNLSYAGSLATRVLGAWGDEESISYHGSNFAKAEIIFFGGTENSNPDPIVELTSSPTAYSFDVTAVRAIECHNGIDGVSFALIPATRSAAQRMSLTQLVIQRRVFFLPTTGLNAVSISSHSDAACLLLPRPRSCRICNGHVYSFCRETSPSLQSELGTKTRA